MPGSRQSVEQRSGGHARRRHGCAGRGSGRPRASPARQPAGEREADAHPELPRAGARRPRGTPNSSIAIVPPGRTTRASSRERRGRVVHVAEEVGEREPVEAAVLERQLARRDALDELDAVLEAAASTRRRPRRASRGSGRRRRPGSRAAASSSATAPVPGRTSSTVSSGPASMRETRNRRQRGSWPKEQERRVAVVGRAERREELARAGRLGHGIGLYPGTWPRGRSERIARPPRHVRDGRGARGRPRGRAGARAPASTSARSTPARATVWLALDDAGEPVADRELVRDAVSIAALCELAEESAGGGDLDELRSQLVALRLTESPEGIEEAEEAALELQQRSARRRALATPSYLDEIGARARRLEQRARPPRRLPVHRGDEGARAAVDELCERRRAGYLQRTATASLGAWRAEASASRSAAIPRISCAACASSPSSRPRPSQEAQREQFATLTLNTAVELTARRAQADAAERRRRRAGDALRDAMRVLFPEAVALVSAARQGFMRES